MSDALQRLESELALLRNRVSELEAREQIRELATAYAVACDQHDMPGLLDLFTADAKFSSPSGLMQAEGVDAIESMFIELFKVRGPAFHWTHDVCVQNVGDNQANGIVYSHAETTPNGTVSIAAMRYFDSYRFQDQRWKFASREIQFLYYVPFSRFGGGLNSEARLTAGSEVINADYPEQLASWQAFDSQFGRSW